MKIARNMSTEECREFWESAERVAAEVRTWPMWKRAGINVAAARESPREAPAPAACVNQQPTTPESAAAINDIAEAARKRLAAPPPPTGPVVGETVWVKATVREVEEDGDVWMRTAIDGELLYCPSKRWGTDAIAVPPNPPPRKDRR